MAARAAAARAGGAHKYRRAGDEMAAGVRQRAATWALGDGLNVNVRGIDVRCARAGAITTAAKCATRRANERRRVTPRVWRQHRGHRTAQSGAADLAVHARTPFYYRRILSTFVSRHAALGARRIRICV
jgi:hypothetical protein